MLPDDIREDISIADGFFGVGKYISLDRIYQEKILHLCDIVYEYIIKRKRRRPFNIYIDASPGSGKSFLVKQINQALNFRIGNNILEYIYCNLTTVSDQKEIGHVLQLAQSCNLRGGVPLVFFDEVDCRLNDGQHAYKNLLAPMFDGIFYQNGVTNHIGLSIFFFAGSQRIDDIYDDKSRRKKIKTTIKETYAEWYQKRVNQKDVTLQKLRTLDTKERNDVPLKICDFFDRIDEFIFVPPLHLYPNKTNSDYDLTNQAQLIALAMLRNEYKETVFVETAVVALLAHKLIKTDSKRYVESILLCSSSPTERIFRLENLPIEFRNENAIFLEEHYNAYKDDAKWFEIVSQYSGSYRYTIAVVYALTRVVYT